MAIITHYAFVQKAGNHAKYGANPPREGYVHSWEEEVEDPSSDEEQEELDRWREEEYEAAHSSAEEYLGYSLRPGRS